MADRTSVPGLEMAAPLAEAAAVGDALPSSVAAIPRGLIFLNWARAATLASRLGVSVTAGGGIGAAAAAACAQTHNHAQGYMNGLSARAHSGACGRTWCTHSRARDCVRWARENVGVGLWVCELVGVGW